MFDYEYKLLIAALTICVLAACVSSALATPAIGIPVPDYRNDRIAVADYPRSKTTGAAAIVLNITFTGESELIILVTSETRNSMRTYTVEVSKSEDGNYLLPAWKRTFEDVNEAVDYTERVRDAALYPFVDITENR